MLDKIIEIIMTVLPFLGSSRKKRKVMAQEVKEFSELVKDQYTCLLYTSPSPRDRQKSRMPSSA